MLPAHFSLSFSSSLRNQKTARAVAVGKDWIRFELVDTERRALRRAAFDSASRLRELDLLGSDGNPVWSVRYDDYAVVGGTPLAHRIRIEVATGAASVEISLSDMELNPELPADIFRLRQSATVGASAAT